MKKYFSLLFAILAALAMLTSTAFAAPAAVSKSVTLVHVEYQKGGVVLLFETTGLTKADLKDNYFFADSNSQPMYCTFVDKTTTVRCTVSKALAGKGNFYATLAGFAFWGTLPQQRDFADCGEGEELWYYFDLYVYGEFDGSGEMPVQIWTFFEEYGFFDFAADEFGLTFEITGNFCGPKMEVSEPT